jgi:hypothetical protein
VVIFWFYFGVIVVSNERGWAGVLERKEELTVDAGV